MCIRDRGIGLEVPFANTNIWSFQTGLNFISKGVKGDGVTDAWDVVDAVSYTHLDVYKRQVVQW